MLRSLHFAAFDFLKAIIVTSMKFMGYSPVSYKLFVSCVIILIRSSPNNVIASPGTSPSHSRYAFMHHCCYASVSPFLFGIIQPVSFISTLNLSFQKHFTNTGNRRISLFQILLFASMIQGACASCTMDNEFLSWG